MDLLKIGYLAFLLAGSLCAADRREFVFQNSTNLPLVIKQGGREVVLCGAFESKRTLIRNGEIACYLSKRKHRASCVPVVFEIDPIVVGMLVFRLDRLAYFRLASLRSELGGTDYEGNNLINSGTGSTGSTLN